MYRLAEIVNVHYLISVEFSEMNLYLIGYSGNGQDIYQTKIPRLMSWLNHRMRLSIGIL